MSTASHPALLLQPLRDVGSWAGHFLRAEIPILASTAEALEDMRANEDAVDANLLGETIAYDPLMTLKVMGYVAAHRSTSRVTDAETVTAALVLLGITPFFRTFGPQPTVEERLAEFPAALEGLRAVLQRAERAAKFALGFAVHRMDHDAAVIHQAALLHDFAEMLLWCHAPALAMEIAQRQQADSTLRSSAVQRDVLHIELADLQQTLMKAWHLPDLLISLSDDKKAHTPQVRNVLLAIRLARHTARGWDNAALPDDIADIAQLLNLAPEPTLKLVQELDEV